jgi:hypothetical protein
MAKFTESQRAVVEGFIAGRSHRQVADLLGITGHAVKANCAGFCGACAGPYREIGAAPPPSEGERMLRDVARIASLLETALERLDDREAKEPVAQSAS